MSKFVRDQKSMDDDNPTIPVNRGAAGVYIPNDSEKQRAKTNLILALDKYLRVTNCDFDVFDIHKDFNLYEVRITKKR